jgi:hypothetical protein
MAEPPERQFLKMAGFRDYLAPAAMRAPVPNSSTNPARSPMQSTRTPSFVTLAVRRSFILLLLPASLLGCQTIDRKTFEEKYPLRAKYSPRWETNEVPYDQAGPLDKAGRNVRDGLVGVFNNFVQGGFAAFSIMPWTGYVVQKMAIMGGDVFGLIDDNPYTEHVFLGVFSRQFLRFGSQARNFPETMGNIHDTTFDAPPLTTLDYVGPKTFHTKVYGAPSAVGAFGTVIVADWFIRPTGNFIMVFGGRKTAKKVDEAGLKLIQMGMDLPFL